MQVDHVEWANRIQEIEVNPRWKQWIECLKIRRVWVSVATGKIKPNTSARLQRQIAEVVANRVRSGPRLNVAGSKRAKLPDVFQVVFPRQRFSPESCAE